MLSLALTWEGHRVRMAGTPEAPEWVAKDVCRVLGLTTHNAGQGIPENEKGHCAIVTPGGEQTAVTVLQSGLYRLITRSRRPAAQRFQSWLFGTVLPSIRKHGCYPPPAERPAVALPNLRDIHQLAAVALQLTEIVAEKDQRIAELEPKAEAHDRLQASDGAVSLQTAGRILGRQPRKLIETLEISGALVRSDRGRLLPAARFREVGYFVVREFVVRAESAEDEDKAYPQTLVTPAGLQWLARRFPSTDRPGVLVPVLSH